MDYSYIILLQISSTGMRAKNIKIVHLS